MGRRFPTWSLAERESEALSPVEERMLETIGQLPLVTADCLLPFAGGCGRRALYQRLAALERRQLIASTSGPPEGSWRPRRLVLLDNPGLAVLARRGGTEPRALARSWRLHRAGLEALCQRLPAVLATYELLGLVAGVMQRAELLMWRLPFRWVVPTTTAAGGQREPVVRIGACATVRWETSEGQRLGDYVLLADTGGLSPGALRRHLGTLSRVRGEVGADGPAVLVASTSERRVDAWKALLDEIASSRNGGPLEARVDSWEAWRSGQVLLPSGSPKHLPVPATAPSPIEEGLRRGSIPRPIDVRRARRFVASWYLGADHRTVLDVVGPHPFLPCSTLADVLGRDRACVRRVVLELRRTSLLRILPKEESPADSWRSELVEATAQGLEMLAGSMGLSLPEAVRHHGLAGGVRRPLSAR